jgi:hypothetical protein
MKTFLIYLSLSLGLFFSALPTANAALQSVGPTDPATTIPSYYQDPANLALQPCTDQNGFCVLTPLFDPAFTNPPNQITTTGPISPTNYPDELFYFLADSIITTPSGAKLVYRAALEAAFLTGATPNTGITFLRINFKKVLGLTANSTYTVTHPYGSFQFTTDSAGNSLKGNAGQAFRVEDPLTPAIGVYFPPDMQGATNTHIGPFLQRAAGLITDPLTGHQYIGDAATPEPVIGSPLGAGGNIFRVDGPNIGGPGVNSIQTNLFTLAGRVFTGTVASPMTIDRATYARDAASGQVDIFTSALPSTSLTLSGSGIPSTTLSEDFPGSGKYFSTLPFSTTLPSSLSITNSRDLPLPIPHPVILVDEVIVSQAAYDPGSKILTIKADSRDQVSPAPVLTVPAFAPPNVLDGTGTLAVSLAGTIPPATVTVTSSKGGAATLAVSVVTPAPFANNDQALVGPGASVVINVLANDVAPAAATLNAGSVAIVTPPAAGSASVNAATGQITYSAAGVSSGTDSFSYTVADSNQHISNAATVTVAIMGLGPAPLAVDDAATVPAAGTVTINVISNDSASSPALLNPATLMLTAPSGGSASANADGTVSYTAPAAAGTYDFAYTVKDNATPAGTSNPAKVTVTVTGQHTAPVAVNDAAATTAGAPIAINVIGNDTASAPSTINPATVLVSQPAPGGGSVAVNLVTGLLTYTPPALAGTYSFTYTVQDNFTTPATSNAATVTVTVAPAPVVNPPTAANDAASTAFNTAVTITVLANDTAGTNPINNASVAIVSPAAHGTAVANAAGTITFTPTANFSGADSFTYTVKDSTGLASNAATVNLTVAAAPVQTIAVSRAQFTLNGASWRVDGTVTPAPAAGSTLTLYNSSTVGGAVLINNVSVGGNGSFTWSSPNNAAQPNAQRKMSLQLNQNPLIKTEGVTVTVR